MRKARSQQQLWNRLTILKFEVSRLALSLIGVVRQQILRRYSQSSEEPFMRLHF
jgi:hypothetical protein